MSVENPSRTKQNAQADNVQLKLGEILIEKGIINEIQLNYGLEIQKTNKEKIGSILVRNGLLSEYDLMIALSRQLGLRYVNLEQIKPDVEFLKRFPQKKCYTQRILPLQKHRNNLLVATSELPDAKLEQEILKACGIRPVFCLAEETRLISAVSKAYSSFMFSTRQLLDQEVKRLQADRDNVQDVESFFTYLLQLALEHRATDVHISSLPLNIDINFRVDGLITHILALPPEMQRIVSAIKLKADMDISEQRLPQDGRFSITILAQEYDIRVSCIVTSYGEDLVLRILPKVLANFTLNSLGFFNKDVNRLFKLFKEPAGLILISGPTGSGKSTTMNAGLTSLDLLEKNVITVEDPIEYLVPLAKQTQVNSDIGYDFSQAVYNFLRHDPDIILVGEMRDPETASAAITASLTGHLVLSTLHSDTEIGTITRLQSLHVENLLLAEGLLAIVTQRLVRKICPKCQTKYTPTPEDIDYLGYRANYLQKGGGCDFCNNTGYYGRTVIYGLLEVDTELTRLLRENAPLHEIERVAKDKRIQNMFETARYKVLQGITTIMELQRVLGSHLRD